MKKALPVLIALVITGSLTYQIVWFNFLLLFIIALLLIFLAVAGFIRLFRKTGRKIFKVPFLIIFVCASGILFSLFKPYEPAVLETGSPGQKLEHAYRTDQQDRKNLKSYVGISEELKSRDALRLAQVKNLYMNGSIIKPMDKFHAAFILHHSNKSEDYKIASQLATEAAGDEELKEHYQVQWLSKAAYDRWMISIGKPPRHNTQDKLSIDVK